MAVSSGALPVAGHDLRAFDGDLAGLARVGDGVAIVVHQIHIGAGQRHANGAGELLGRHRVALADGAGLRQAIALANRATGFFQPQLGHGALHGHAAADRYLQVAPVDGVEVGWWAKPLNSVFTAGKLWKVVLGQLLERRLQIARVGDQDGFAARAHGQHHVHREREDVVQRQRAHAGELLARSARYFITGLYQASALQHVGDHVAVQQHRALAHARGAAGVLQQGDIVGARHRRLVKRARCALRRWRR